MYTTVVSTATPPDPSSHLAFFLEGLKKARKQKSRIYRTYVDMNGSQDRRYVLMTTSKDMHLKLGSIEWAVQYHFAKFLHDEFVRNHCFQLLLCFEDKEREAEEGILISMTTEEGSTIFTLSPAR